ncbi:MAG: DUF4863 family protein [Pseudomonadota bacterium]|nr:DUF4863 family protein [Pseudomonadota bacterium]
MSKIEFETLIKEITDTISKKPVDDVLEKFLSETYPIEGEIFKKIQEFCQEGERDGWCCDQEFGGIKFGRVIKPGGIAGHFSVDIVRMGEVKGPHHIHPNGEIGMIMPIDGEPRFDGMGQGWYVDKPGSDHWPTVEGGTCHVLYLLPDGAINFTGK